MNIYINETYAFFTLIPCWWHLFVFCDRVPVRRPGGVVCEHGSLRDRLLPARGFLLRHLWAVQTRRPRLRARYERPVLNGHYFERPLDGSRLLYWTFTKDRFAQSVSVNAAMSLEISFCLNCLTFLINQQVSCSKNGLQPSQIQIWWKRWRLHSKSTSNGCV